MSQPNLPGRARVVVVGGGIIGCSVAYHLAHMGWKDVVLLERDRLTSGTTWHAAGLMVTFGSTSETSTEMRKYTRDLYARLEAETGLATGFKPVGFIEVAADADRLEEYRRVSAFNRYCGVDVHEISPSQVRELFPLARTDDLLAGFYVKEDGRVNPVDVTMSLAKGARMKGVTILEGVPATEILHERGAVTGVRTPLGDIEAEYVVNCAGMWARQLGAKAGVNIPLQSAEHYYLITEKMPGLLGVVPRARGSGVARLLPRGGGRPDDRPVRARVRALEGGRRARGLLVRRDPARLGSHGQVPREGDGAGAHLARDGHQEVLLRPRELHARPSAGGGRGARDQELLRRRRPQLDRHPHRRRPRARARALDHQRSRRRRRHRLQHRPPAHVPDQPRVPRARAPSSRWAWSTSATTPRAR